MADKKGLSRFSVRKKVDSKADKEKEKEKEKENKEEKSKKPGKPEKPPEQPKTDQPKAEKPKTEEEKPTANGESAQGAEAMEEDGEFKLEPIELPPFEIIIGERMSPFYYKFQFRNVEYSSGRNKTFLCYLVDIQDKSKSIDGMRGYLEDEHSGAHAEEAFFHQVLPQYDAAKGYVITWYTSSSPCAACAAKIVEVLRTRKTLRLTIFCSRLFEWEEPEIVEGLKALAAAGCKLRMMRPLDFTYTWDTFVENEEQTFAPWEDCQENYDYYDERLSNILQ